MNLNDIRQKPEVYMVKTIVFGAEGQVDPNTDTVEWLREVTSTAGVQDFLLTIDGESIDSPSDIPEDLTDVDIITLARYAKVG
jgi:hypothetical protein